MQYLLIEEFIIRGSTVLEAGKEHQGKVGTVAQQLAREWCLLGIW